jgi:citrate/tricarballylate utilization protein
MERRLNFTEADLNYLANLCHNCGECYYACQYAPPHEFAVDVPKTLSEIRTRSYRQYAWPRALPPAFPWWILAVCLIPALFAFKRKGDFYDVVPHEIMVAVFGTVSIFIMLALVAGLIRFWGSARVTAPAILAAIRDVLSLRYLGTKPRRWFHHFTFYGFMLCFAATTVAAFDHYALGLRAPYGCLSLPVMLGTLGGIGLLAGPAGLYWLKRRRDPALTAPGDTDLAFLTLLFLTSLTGLMLLALRETRAMSTLLVVHLGVVLALFLTLPYGKFVHGIYRAAALVRNALEQQRGNQSHHGSER